MSSLTWPDFSPLDLPGSPRAAAQARRYVEGALCTAPPEVLATAVLLTSELVANAITDGTPITVRVFGLAAVLRVEVASGGVVAPPRQASARSSSAEHGRGLLLVGALAADWGHIPHRHSSAGRTAWFELALV